MIGLLGLPVTVIVNHQSKHVIVHVLTSVQSATILVRAKNKNVTWKSVRYQRQRNARGHGKSGDLVMPFVELVLVPASDHASVEHQAVQDVRMITPKPKSVKAIPRLCAYQATGQTLVNVMLNAIKPVNNSVTAIVSAHQS